ncbi:MAG TPA: MFS transporter [Kofleriaceae bacterium]|nr:MFS transporter [Kofleriaceae bacterium]
MAADPRRTLDIRPGELVPFALSFIAFTALLAASYVLRPLRDALGIHGGVHTYPWLFTGTFVATLVLYPLLAAIATRTTRTRFAVFTYGLVVAGLLVFRLLIERDPHGQALARAFFVFVSVFNVLLVSTFWSVMTDVFSNQQSRRLFGPIAAGGTAGALLGPVLASTLVSAIGVPGLLLVAATLIGLTIACVVALDRAGRRVDGAGDHARPVSDLPIGGTTLDGLKRVARSRYLLSIAGYIVLLTATATIAYFQQGWIVQHVIPDTESRTELFAVLDLLTNGVTLLIQIVLTRWLLANVGLSWVLAILPVVTAIGFAGLASAPVLAVFAVFQVTRRASDYGLARPAREVLFTVVPREDKFKAKNVVDVVVYRASDAAFAWLTLLMSTAGLGVTATSLVALPLCAAWVAGAIALGRQERRIAREKESW